MATTRSGFLTLIGLPNAGKSSLMNRLVGEDIAIVTPKAQTTRVNMRGFVVKEGLRLSITDTPGLQEGAKALNQVLTRNAALALKNASRGGEALALVVDAIELIKRHERGELTGLEALPDLIVRHVGDGKIPAPVFPVFNKGDLVHSVAARAKCEGLLKPLLDAVFSDVRATHWISANLGKGVDELLASVTATLPVSDEELFDAEALSDQPMRALAGEFVREQCFLRLGHELPYEIAVEIDEFDEKDPKCLRVQAVLHVERESQKSIVIGTKGAKVKEIGTEARLRMERFLDRKVFLGIKVKVTPGWSRRESDVERFGYGNVHS